MIPLEGGIGAYFTLTDAELIGTVPPPDNYIYLTTFLGNYQSGYQTYASLFSNTLDDENVSALLDAVARMHITSSIEDMP